MPPNVRDTLDVVRNADVSWDQFDPNAYFATNYATLRRDDAQIIDALCAFYVNQCHGMAILDVGTGPNLYPVLAALPYASRIDVVEPSEANREWLRRHTTSAPYPWEPFWRYLCDISPTHAMEYPNIALGTRLNVIDGNIFDLPHSAWDVASMHFVAESITSDPAEFSAAIESFVCALRDGGSFAATFMENSSGYVVGDLRLPAVAVTAETVTAAFEPWAADVFVTRIPLDDVPLRAGYSGMIFATGRRAR